MPRTEAMWEAVIRRERAVCAEAAELAKCADHNEYVDEWRTQDAKFWGLYHSASNHEDALRALLTEALLLSREMGQSDRAILAFIHAELKKT